MLSAETRRAIRNRSPRVLRNAVLRLRAAVEAPPIDVAVARPYVFEPSTVAAPRFTLVVPSLDPRDAFGGVATGLRTFFGIASELMRETPLDLRIIAEDIRRDASRELCLRAARAAGLATSDLELVGGVGPGATVDVRAHDVFATYNWWTTLNSASLTAAQADHFGRPRTPLLYLVQDYEPGFYAFSTAHMYARDALGAAAPTWALFNTGLLRDYTFGQGHAFERAFALEPELDPTLRAALAERSGAPRRRRIVVYGRPHVERNCFSAVVSGLREWGGSSGAGWEVVSVGTHHREIEIAAGVSLRSLGKLSLDEYAEVLASSLVGLSLMASPHPSYPPLEMAMSGLRTVTNSYANKDLGGLRPGLVSVPDLQPSTIATALDRACREALDAGPLDMTLDGTLTGATGDTHRTIAVALAASIGI